jgi:hypothetical protein
MLSGGSPGTCSTPAFDSLEATSRLSREVSKCRWDMSVNPKNIEELAEDAALLSLGAKTFERDQSPSFKSLGTVLQREIEKGLLQRSRGDAERERCTFLLVPCCEYWPCLAQNDASASIRLTNFAPKKEAYQKCGESNVEFISKEA